MKKRYSILPILLPMLAALLTACGSDTTSLRGYSIEKKVISAEEAVAEMMESEEDASAESGTEPEKSQEDTAFSGTQSCTVDNITFEVNGSWEAIAGYEGAFSADGGACVYQLQGISRLSSYTPEDFYQELEEYYASSYDVTYSDDTLNDILLEDGTEALVGRIEMTTDGVIFSIDVLIAPRKNTVVTFACQHPEDITISSQMDIRLVTASTKFSTGAEDLITGQTLIASDGSELCLNADGSFIYYQETDNYDGAYCDGTYEVWYGQEAFDQVVSMTDYGLTEEELEQTLAANMNGYSVGGSMPYDFFEDDTSDTSESEEGYFICKDTFYAVVLHNDKMVDREEVTEMGHDTLYIGYYVQELDLFDMLNANTANYAQWTLK